MLFAKLDPEVPPYAARLDLSSPRRPDRVPVNLAEAVEIAVDQVDATLLEPVTEGPTAFTFQARTLLGLLTYSYARHVYSSEEIATQLRREIRVCWTAPDAALLRQFRTANREALVFCLRSALLFIAEEKIQQGLVTHVNRAYALREAVRRITVAIFTDSLEACDGPQRPTRTDIDYGVWVRRGRPE